MANYGVIDLGSNTVRLAVFDVKDNWRGERPVTSKNIKTIANDKVIAGLSAYVEDGEFTGDGMAKAIDVLIRHLKRAKYFDCKRIDIFATAVLRNCANTKAALAIIESSIDAPINLLSARDEAHLSFVGASCDKNIEDGVMVDLGGGSLELVRVEDGTDHDDISIPQGSLSSYADYVKFIIPQEDEARAIKTHFEELVEAQADFESYQAKKLYAVGGSARAAAKLYAAACGLPQRPKTLTPQHLHFLVNLLLGDPARFSHLAARAVAERVHTVGPGCIILSELMDRLGAKSLEICKRGVREGYLIERMLNC